MCQLYRKNQNQNAIIFNLLIPVYVIKTPVIPMYIGQIILCLLNFADSGSVLCILLFLGCIKL